jgi:DNA gyrase subunit A
MQHKKSSNLNIDDLLSNEEIIVSDISNEIEDSILNYSIKTIVDRAIPDIRDGLKPVHRRILFGGYMDTLWPEKKYEKNAGVVGTVMKFLHPHGSSYETLVSMSQPWTYRYPLWDFQGNNGSLDGDGAAAERYTEGRLHKHAMIMLQDINMQCVDFKSNYAENMEEPVYLPALFPNLLCNGGMGIATGYTTNIPSHNLKEVIDAIIYVIKNSDCKLENIMGFIKGPDMPLGSILIDDGSITELYETGKGGLTFRAKYSLEYNDENKNQQIVINELPPDINKSKLMEQLYKVCIEDKKIARINDIRDESTVNIRIVIELQKTAIPEIIMKELYDKTNLEKKNTYILRAITNQTPKVFSLKEIIENYIENGMVILKYIKV